MQDNNLPLLGRGEKIKYWESCQSLRDPKPDDATMLPLAPCTLQPPKHVLSICFWSRVPLKQSLTCPVESRFNHHCVTGWLFLQYVTGVFLHLLLWEHDHWMLPGESAHSVKTNTALREAKSQVMREASWQHTHTKMNASTS